MLCGHKLFEWVRNKYYFFRAEYTTSPGGSFISFICIEVEEPKKKNKEQKSSEEGNEL